MAEKLSKSTKLFNRFTQKVDSILQNEEAKYIYDQLSAGKTKYMRLNRSESSAYDLTWIKIIEEVLFDLNEIIKNPRQVNKVVANLVPVELAKKTNAESVQHLASHTQYIKSIDEKGNVVPNKILSMSYEDDIHTYENKFIATFIRKLVLFVEKRYEFARHFSPLHNEEVLYFKTEAKVRGADVNVETKVKVRKVGETQDAVLNTKYFARIEAMRKYILYYYNSAFMRELKTEKNVRNPILQTNIIKKNPKYRHCYEVYKFIERYGKFGISYKVSDETAIFNEEELSELNKTMFVNFLTLKNADIKARKKKTRVYKPKIVSSLDDEQFVYGPYLEGPIEFLRIDDKYQEYLYRKLKKDLPLHPTNLERRYYSDEYAYKREYKEDKVEKARLIRRKAKEARDFDKEIAKIIEQRNYEEAEFLKLLKEAIAEEEKRRLDIIRKKLIKSAIGSNTDVNEQIDENIEDLKGSLCEELASQIKEEQLRAENETSNEAFNEQEFAPQNDFENEAIKEEPTKKTSIEIEENKTEEVVPSIEEETSNEENIAEDTQEEQIPEEQIHEEGINEPETEDISIDEIEAFSEKQERLEAESQPATEPLEVTPSDELTDEEIEEFSAQNDAKEQVEAQPENEPINEKESVRASINEENEANEEPQEYQSEAIERFRARDDIPDDIKEEIIRELRDGMHLLNSRELDTNALPEEEYELSGKKSTPRVHSQKQSSSQSSLDYEALQNAHELEMLKKFRKDYEDLVNSEEITRKVEEYTKLKEQNDEDEEYVSATADYTDEELANAKEEILNLEDTEDEFAEEEAKYSEDISDYLRGKDEKLEEEYVEAPISEEEDTAYAQMIEDDNEVIIPGVFIVKTKFGYYVDDDEYSKYKGDAKIFLDYNKARRIKDTISGKVVKL